LRFTGKERDTLADGTPTGLDYLGARYYSGAQGRFTSPDPVKVTPDRLRDPQQFNLYAYARNSPLRYIDPSGQILQLAGDVNQAQQQLCQWLGTSDCAQRISYDQKSNTVTVDLNGIDTSQNEGAMLLGQLVGSQNVYNLTLGNQYMTAEGLKSLGNEAIVNNSNSFDPPRFPYDKPAGVRPPKGVDSLVAIDPANAKFRDSQGRPVPLSSIMFHEMAEAYSKVDLGKPYIDFDLGYVQGGFVVTAPVGFQRGAHNDAVQREINLRNQRPNMQVGGRAGDVLIRDPK
jgi:RHS repeat-associated protein